MIAFTKMQTLGNDFVIINIDEIGHIDTDWVRQLCDRHTGIGCDQLLGYRIIDLDEPTVKYHIFNADGSEVEQCGNGALCLSQHLFEQVLPSTSESLILQTTNRSIHTQRPNPTVRVNMGVPLANPNDLPMQGPKREHYELKTELGCIPFYAISMGNPHAIVPKDMMPAMDLNALGALFNHHPYFPQGVNVSVLTIIKADCIEVEVYERGVGPTLACGSAASAAGYVAHQHFDCDHNLRVNLPGGTLGVQIEHGAVWLSGPTTTVFQGQYML